MEMFASQMSIFKLSTGKAASWAFNPLNRFFHLILPLVFTCKTHYCAGSHLYFMLEFNDAHLAPLCWYGLNANRLT